VTVSAAGPDAQEAVAALITILGEATKVGGLPVHRDDDLGYYLAHHCLLLAVI